MLTRRPIPIHVSGGKLSLYSDASLMGSCGDNFSGDSSELKVLQRQVCFTGGFCLEPRLKQYTSAACTLGGQPYTTEIFDCTRRVINSSTLKEGCAARFQKTAFGDINSFKDSRVEGDIKLPPRHVKDIFCADVKRKDIVCMNWRLRKSVTDTRICDCIFGAGFKPEKKHFSLNL